MPHTVLVTGATGYIAKHIVRMLLDDGHTVVGSARSQSRDTEMRSALKPALKDPAALDRYRTVALDLGKDEGWQDALQGIEVLMHTASPFPLEQPKDAEEVIRPAVDGALRALRAAKAAGCKNVVMTSSTVSIMDPLQEKEIYTEADWTDPEKPKLSPYAQSKTLAERAAWEFIENEAPDIRFSVVNPSFVVGAPLDRNFGTSIKVIERLMKGKDPASPRLSFACCDVQDVARAHLCAMTQPDAAGNRHLVFEQSLWFADMARLIKEAVPEVKPPLRVAPDLLVKFLALFDPAIRGIVPSLGRSSNADNSRLRTVLGIEPRDVRESIRETARYLWDNKLV